MIAHRAPGERPYRRNFRHEIRALKAQMHPLPGSDTMRTPEEL